MSLEVLGKLYFFTKSASDLAKANNVELIDRDALKHLIKSDSVSDSDLQVKNSESRILGSADKRISSSNIVAWDDEIEKQDIELLCPSCRQNFTYNIEIQKLIAGQSIKTNCPNCEMPVSISLCSSD